MRQAAWSTTRLRHVVDLNPSAGKAARLSDGTNVSFMAMESLHESGTISLDVVRPVEEVRAAYSAFEDGDVVFAKVTPCFENGKAALAAGLLGGVGFGTTEVTVLRAREGVDAKYLYYSTTEDSFRQGAIASMVGAGGLKRVSDRFVKDYRLALPPLDEQRQIAEYLDRETGQIDALIAKQEQLIGTLTERRQAVIAQAVTRGLHSSATTSVSGEWFGSHPAHWNSGNIRHFAQMKTGHTPSRSVPGFWADADVPWFTLADVWQLRNGHKYLGDTNESISFLGLASSSAELLPAGTVVLSRTASVGFTGIMPSPMATSQDYWNWVPGKTLHSEYLWYQFQAMRPYLRSLMYGSTHKTIYQADAAGINIVVPPTPEQNEIVQFLDAELSRMKTLMAKAEEVVGMLRERRQALISEAVTGKIDVRGL